MYTKDFIPITPEEIRMVNASALAKQFSCTSSYVSRILKFNEKPANEKAQQIHDAARAIIKKYADYQNTL